MCDDDDDESSESSFFMKQFFRARKKTKYHKFIPFNTRVHGSSSFTVPSSSSSINPLS